MYRRDFIEQIGIAGLGLSVLPSSCLAAQVTGNEVIDLSGKLPVNQLTSKPMQHWFGYYDKRQINSSGKYALGNEVELFFRSPKSSDKLNVGYVDLEHDNKWNTIGQSSAWGWQQGCMLQWLPNSEHEVIWNARLEDNFVSIIQNIKTGERRILPKPIYTLSPDGLTGYGIDFGRLQFFRPGYGYATSDSSVPEPAPENTGLYKMNLKTGEHEIIVSYKDLAELSRPLGSVKDNYHWINHILTNPSGDRLIFLNRSRPFPTPSEYREKTGKALDGPDELYVTRAITVNADGSDLYALNDSGHFSHFIWKGEDKICAWAEPENNDKTAFYVFQDKTKKYRIIGEELMTRNGHNTYVPGTNYEWILNDTYPHPETREQELYLFHVPTKKKVILGRFQEPEKFRGEWRCDLHPRCNQQGTKVYFDSTHNGDARQMYEIDIEKIISGKIV